jgi:plastocyanin
MRRAVVALLIAAFACVTAVLLIVWSMSPSQPAGENLTLDAPRNDVARADEPVMSQMSDAAPAERKPEAAPANRASDDATTKPSADAAPPPAPVPAPAPAAKVEAAPAPTGDGAAKRGETVIDQKNRQFSATTVTMKAGEKIKFVNADTVAHNVIVTTPDRKLRNSGVQEPGQSATMQFDEAGQYDIECAIHPQMRMTAVVK